MPPNPFRVLKHGLPIEDFPIRDAVDPGITYSPIFEELSAVKDYGLDAERWYIGDYSAHLMATIIAHHRMRGLVDLHVEQARNEKANRDAKRKK